MSFFRSALGITGWVRNAVLDLFDPDGDAEGETSRLTIFGAPVQ
jgi:hypothetical protein